MGTFFDILGYLKTVRNFAFGKSLVASRRHEILLETNWSLLNFPPGLAYYTHCTINVLECGLGRRLNTLQSTCGSSLSLCALDFLQ